MIVLYSGTPGSGKSLHMAKDISYYLKKTNRYVIVNFEINLDNSFSDEQRARLIYLPNEDLTIEFLLNFSDEHKHEFSNAKFSLQEKCFLLFIDEAQILFNARKWNSTKNQNWGWFFAIHRHLGYRIILGSQMDSNLDKQCRGVIEYNYVHRKISNIGLAGKFVNLLTGGGLFYCVQFWYPMRMKVGGTFFKYRKKYGSLYETHALFKRSVTNADDLKKHDIKIAKTVE